MIFRALKAIAYLQHLRILPDDKSSWDINFELYQVEFTDNAGINRPTQALIDDGFILQGKAYKQTAAQYRQQVQ